MLECKLFLQNVEGGGGGGLKNGSNDGMKEWIKRYCLCFTPSRIALAGKVFFGLMQETVRRSRYMI